MKIVDVILSAGIGTWIFILVSNVVLFIIQVLIGRIRYYKYLRVVSFIALHVLFGLLLSRISSYNFVVHLTFYVLPTNVFFLIYHLVRAIKKKRDAKPKFIFKYRTARGAFIKIYNIFS